MFCIKHRAHDSSNGDSKAVLVTATLLLQYFFLSINAALSTVSAFPCIHICKKTLFKKDRFLHGCVLS